MIELGKYAFSVLASYGISISIIILLIFTYLVKARKISKQLHEIETEWKSKDKKNETIH